MSEDAAGWRDKLIPHYALNAALLPAQDAPWSELFCFAGTFDGCVVFPSTLSTFVNETREAFAAPKLSKPEERGIARGFAPAPV
jgi:hypothetical protein